MELLALKVEPIHLCVEPQMRTHGGPQMRTHGEPQMRTKSGRVDASGVQLEIGGGLSSNRFTIRNSPNERGQSLPRGRIAME
jgi:hypothetical protein